MARQSPFDNPGDQWPRFEVRVLPYDHSWAERFDFEADQLRRSLGDAIHAVEHFGSTSVPGLSAKPIVDIVVELTRRLEPLDRAALWDAGYIYERNVDDPDITFLAKGAHEVHLQLVPRAHPSVVTKLAVRDYLRAHPNEARLYADTKEAIAATANGIAKDYALGKRAFVDALEARALEWVRRGY
jgi:GrpB-like predicted nucleotidyltransferase (UPF0157 family)